MAHCAIEGGCHRTFSTDRNATVGHPGGLCASDEKLGWLGLVRVRHAHGVIWRWAKPRHS